MSMFGKMFRAATVSAVATAAAPVVAQTPARPDPAAMAKQAFLDTAKYTEPTWTSPAVTPAGANPPAASQPVNTNCPPAAGRAAPYYTPGGQQYCPPGTPSYLPPGMPGTPAQPGTPQQPGTPGTPNTPAPTVSDPGPSLPNLFAGADAGPSMGLGGYIDNALPVTTFRLRYDSNYGNNRPDRAEFFYAKCGCFATPAGGNQLNAKGPPLPETSVDYQELTPYFEYAITKRFSVFANIPIRFINPEQNANAAGVSDVSFGAKYALLYDPQQVLSLQMRVITPTGNTYSGLGTGVTWLEPGLLYQRQMSAKWQVFGELKDQIYLERQSDFTGNVLTYGLGTSYIVANGCWGYVAPVGEVVGWTALGGKELMVEQGPAGTVNTGVKSATGDTIVNGKFGVRIGFGKPTIGQPFPTASDLYIGYGRALTGEVWYKDMLRVEYRRFF